MEIIDPSAYVNPVNFRELSKCISAQFYQIGSWIYVRASALKSGLRSGWLCRQGTKGSFMVQPLVPGLSSGDRPHNG